MISQTSTLWNDHHFELMSTSVTSHHDLFFSFGGNRTIYSFSIFQAYNTAWVPWSKFQWEQSILLLGLTAYSATDVTYTQYSLWASPNQHASWVHCSLMLKGLFESSAQGRWGTHGVRVISSAHAHAPLSHQTPLTNHKVSDKVSKIMKKGTANWTKHVGLLTVQVACPWRWPWLGAAQAPRTGVKWTSFLP